MKHLNQTWEKDEVTGEMVLISEEEVEVPDPEKTIEEKVQDLEQWQKTLSSQ